jgi:hypothetical protein
MEEQPQKSEWNIDDSLLMAIYSLKIKFLKHIEAWELERAYWTLCLIDSEINPAMKDEDQETLNEKMKVLEDERKKLTREQEGNFYVSLNNTYKEMNRMMIESGWYFRRKELYMGL